MKGREKMETYNLKVVPVTSGEKFAFQCRRCGACCRHVKESVPLESLDAYRIAKYLKEKGEASCVEDVLERFAVPVLLDGCGYMAFMLAVTGEEDACVFLRDGRCSVHEVKPRACRTYPIEISPDGSETLLCMDYTHHFEGPQRSVERWVQKYFTQEDKEFLDCDTGAVMTIAKLLRQVPEREAAHAIALFMYYKYAVLELEKPFTEQFEKNNGRLIAALEKIVNESAE